MIEYLREAFLSLGANRLRTVLALVGLSVGVSAVIAIQILGHATSGAMTGVFQGLSNYTFIIQPNFQNGFDSKSGVTTAQVDQLNSIPHVVQAIPNTQLTLQAKVGHADAQLSFAPVGGDPNFYPEPFAHGRPISAQEVGAASRVCVLSNFAASKLNLDPSLLDGRMLRAGPIRCRIVGVLSKPPQGALNLNFAPDVSIPYTLFERLYFRGSSKVYAMQVLVDDPSNIAKAEDRVKKYLSNLKDGKYTYQTFDNQFLANAFNKIFLVLTVIVGAIGAISLVVAGIGIMNILLVSIAERTREIGVRKAIGGKRSQIMLQFLMEAAALAFGGCTIGTAAGLGLGWWINSAYIVKISGVTVPLQWQASVALAVIFATVVTAAFGLYPAFRAARLDPIEALRYE